MEKGDFNKETGVVVDNRGAGLSISKYFRYVTMH